MKTTLLMCGALLLGAGAQAQAQAQATQDPWLPPAARSGVTPATETRGAALQAQVLAKLETQFQRADATGRGALTLAEAQRAGWGFAVQNFAELDGQGRGEIRIQDLRRFVQRRQQQR